MNVERMKQLLLEQAIQGRLVPQLDEEPEVEQIGEALKKVPFEIPEKWKWCQISHIQKTIRGITFPASAKKKHFDNGLIRCLTTGSIQKEHKPTSDVFVDSHYMKSTQQILQHGDIIISTANSKDLVGKNIFWHDHEDSSTFGGFLTVARANQELIFQEYLYLIYQYLYCSGYLAKISSQTTNIANISNKTIASLIIPLPPLPEQRRIVARLQTLLPLIENYEKNQAELARLAELFKASLLQEAIQGKLVPQLDEEPAVEQIGETPKDVPFEIPEKWKWCKLSDVGKIVGGGTPKSNIAEFWSNGSIQWFTPADLGKLSDIYAFESGRKITEQGLNNSSATLMPPGTILFSSRAPIGHIAIAKQECCTNQGCKSLVPNKQLITTEWGFYIMKARTQDMIARASGTTFKEISGKGVAATLIPLPHLPEQRRIVARLQELQALADKLIASAP